MTTTSTMSLGELIEALYSGLEPQLGDERLTSFAVTALVNELLDEGSSAALVDAI